MVAHTKRRHPTFRGIDWPSQLRDATAKSIGRCELEAPAKSCQGTHNMFEIAAGQGCACPAIGGSLRGIQVVAT